MNHRYFNCLEKQVEMAGKNFQRETGCPFTSSPLEDAYGPEISLFLHCHLRGYDRNGEGLYPDYGNTIELKCNWNAIPDRKFKANFREVSQS